MEHFGIRSPVADGRLKHLHGMGDIGYVKDGEFKTLVKGRRSPGCTGQDTGITVLAYFNSIFAETNNMILIIRVEIITVARDFQALNCGSPRVFRSRTKKGSTLLKVTR